MFLVLLSGTGLAQFSYPSYEKGLSLKPEDGSASMKFSFRIQSLATYQTSENSDAKMSAMIRRMRLKSSGYVHDPKFEYKLELALSNRDLGNSRDASMVSDGSKVVLDAVVKYHMSKRSQIWFGQTKLPGNRERVISSMALQFVDRSNVNSRFNIDRDFGVQYRYNLKDVKMPLVLSAAITTGEGRNITANNEKLGMAYTGRVEFYPFGNFTKKGDYFAADLKREETPKLAIGVTYCFNQNTIRSGGQLGSFVYELDTNGNATGDFVHNDIKTLFVDMMFKYQGFSFMSEYGNKQLAEQTSIYTHGSGFVAQAGYLFENNYEIATRYTSVDLAQGSGNLKNTTEYTLGLSRYIVDHKLKVQSDVAYISTEGSDKGDVRVRFQVELGI